MTFIFSVMWLIESYISGVDKFYIFIICTKSLNVKTVAYVINGMFYKRNASTSGLTATY